MAPDETLIPMSVNLTEKSLDELQELQELLDDSATDVVNRAIQIYALMISSVRRPLGTTFRLVDLEIGSPRFLHCMVDSQE